MSGHFRWNKDYVLAIVDNHIIDYPTPINLSYAWSFGALAGICLVIQIITGIFLAMHYTPHIDLAFASVEHIMRDVNSGWLIRYMHANGASMFFIVVYSHIFRGLYYGSYMTPREHLWCSGVIIFLLMMATAFMGYVLPWGQMSFWGATVITNLFSDNNSTKKSDIFFLIFISKFVNFSVKLKSIISVLKLSNINFASSVFPEAVGPMINIFFI